MKLADQQALLAEAIRGGSSGGADCLAAEDNPRLSPAAQVDIYREQFWLRHRDCLREDFASLEHCLGEEAFDDLARAYLAKHPCTSYSLRDLGAHMPRFLTEHEPWARDPFLADLARVEWAFIECFDGPDAPAFDPKSIEGRTEDEWPNATLVFHPSLQRLALGFAAHDYRIAARKDEDPARPQAHPHHVVVYRGPDLLHVLEVDAQANALLDELVQGAALGVACERAAKASRTDLEAFQSQLASWFATWTAQGWIRAVRFP